MSDRLSFRDRSNIIRKYLMALQKARKLKTMRDALILTIEKAYPVLKKEKVNLTRIFKDIKREESLELHTRERKMTMFLYGGANITQEVSSMLNGKVPLVEVLSTIKKRCIFYRKNAPRGSKKQYQELEWKFDYAYLMAWQRCIQDLKLKGFPPRKLREYSFEELKEILEMKMRHSKRELDEYEKRERKFIEVKKKLSGGAE